MFWDSQAQLALMLKERMGGRKKDSNERVVGCCWKDERMRMGIAAAGTASDLMQSNARNDMGIWDMGMSLVSMRWEVRVTSATGGGATSSA